MSDLGNQVKNSYVVFQCKKCNIYLYVKESQKQKKCSFCGATFNVKDICRKGVIVEGIHEAEKFAREKQKEILSNDIEQNKEFRAKEDFSIIKKNQKKAVNIFKSDNILLEKFTNALVKVYSQYGAFPEYILKIAASEVNLSTEEFERFFQILIKGKKLIKERFNYYSVKAE